MAKRSSTLPLSLPTDTLGQPAYRAIYGALREAILAGSLLPGARLPGTRELAREQGVARGTVVSAYELLLAEGYVEGNVGSGTYVARALPDDFLEMTRHVARKRRASVSETPRLSDFARRVRRFSANEMRPVRAFRADLPALDLFPTALWARLASRRARRLSASQLLGCDPLGFPPLRAAVADYLATSRGVRASADQVVIVSGVQEALALAARLVLDPGDRAAVEEPGYAAASLAFEAAGARVRAVAVDDEGLQLDRRALSGARIVYLTPAHQYPLGVTMSLARRLALLDWAAATGAFLLEDDYDSEYRYSGRPIPALQGLDERGVVLFAGSFNKVLFPALRLGYLVVPPGFLDAAAASISITTRHRPLFEQLVLLDFLAEGHFGRHLRRMRGIYGERLDMLVETARSQLSGRLALSPVEAGLQTSARLQDGTSAARVVAAAAQHDVELLSLARYYRGTPGPEGLLLGFAAAEPAEIRRGVEVLSRVLDAEKRRASAGTG